MRVLEGAAGFGGVRGGDDGCTEGEFGWVGAVEGGAEHGGGHG